jgi:small membrane protein
MNWNLPHAGVNTFQVIFVPLCAFLAVRSVVRTWSGRVPRLSGLLGIVVWSTAAVAIALPDLTSLVANTLGINRGADLVFYLAILGGVSVCFFFYQRSRQLEDLLTELIRREAIRNSRFGSQAIRNESESPR